jgi:hypothetical protein
MGNQKKQNDAPTAVFRIKLLAVRVKVDYVSGNVIMDDYHSDSK